MLRKNFLFCFLPVLLISCSGSAYYFNKRIGHIDHIDASKKELSEEQSFCDQAHAGTDPWDLNSEAGPVVVLQESKSGVLFSPVAQVQNTRSYPDSTKRPRVVEKENGEYVVMEEPESVAEDEKTKRDSGWGTFWLILGISSLVIFLVALALGLTVGQALLAIPLTYLFIVIVLVDWL